MRRDTESTNTLLSGFILIGMVGIGVSDAMLPGQLQVIGIALCLAVIISSLSTTLAVNYAHGVDSQTPAAQLYRQLLVLKNDINNRIKTAYKAFDRKTTF